MMEKWKEIDGFNGGYLVSNLGRIMSLKHNKGFERPAYIKPCEHKAGYLYVYLYSNGGRKALKVHRLVAECFVKNPMNKKEVNHIDGNKKNNYYRNLSWSTHKENMSHAYKNGLIDNRGEKSSVSKLTNKDVYKIRKLYDQGCLQKDIAIKFDTTRATISRIINRKTWSHI